MVVASIDANVLALMPCVPLMVAVALVASGTHREGKSQQPQRRERNQQRGNRNALALPLPELSEGKEPEAATRESQRHCLVAL